MTSKINDAEYCDAISGRLPLGPFWGSRLGKLVLLGLFVVSIGVGMTLATTVKWAMGW